MRVVLREIDFPLQIYQSKTVQKKQEWMAKMETTNVEYQERLQERRELEKLEQQAKNKKKEKSSE
jgi:hypothetical protein